MRDFLTRYREGLFLGLLLSMSLLLVSHQLRDDSGTTYLRRSVLAVLFPLQRTVAGAADNVSGAWNSYLSLVGVREENRKLQGELSRITTEIQALREELYRAGRLEEFAQYQKSSGMKGLPAQVIGESPDPWVRTIIVDQGYRQGVGKGLAVVTAAGLVGRVIEVGPDTSVVRLIVDRASSVPVLVSRSRARALLEGENSGTCQLKYLIRTEDVRDGDMIITSGLSGIFPRGIEVGTVSEIVRQNYGLYQYAKVLPRVPLARLEDVLILTGPLPGAPP